ncbi:ead/Ea22-like family protein [Escherichia coli O128ac:H26]
MSKIDYQALREAAEKATWGDWDSYKPHRGARGYEVRLSSQAIAQHVLKNNAEFIAAFNPKIALALLDERERNQQYIKNRDQENEDIALTVGKLRVELEAAEKRIAELESLTVPQLPQQAVPDEMPEPDTARMFFTDAVVAIAKVQGWNACRAAMLQGKGGE